MATLINAIWLVSWAKVQKPGLTKGVEDGTFYSEKSQDVEH